MSALDKLSSVTIDRSSVVSASLAKKIQDAADLANEYITITNQARTSFEAIQEKQVEVLDALSPQVDRGYGTNDYHLYYRTSEYSTNKGLEFDEFIKHTIGQFISLTVSAIDTAYKVNFTVETDALTTEFVETGINVDRIYELLSSYLGGKTFAQVKNAEVVAEFAELIKRGWRSWRDEVDPTEDTITKYAHVEVNGVELVVDYFYHNDSWNNSMSYATQNKLATLQRYMREVVGEVFTDFGYFDAGMPWKPQGTAGSIVKQMRLFKNGKLKVTFHTPEGAQKFLNPLMDYFIANK